MSKKDFIALADELRDVLTDSPDAAHYRVDIQRARMIDALCSFMRSQNPAFKEDRWRDYLVGECGPSGGAVRRIRTTRGTSGPSLPEGA